jgi:hypothetical protein
MRTLACLETSGSDNLMNPIRRDFPATPLCKPQNSRHNSLSLQERDTERSVINTHPRRRRHRTLPNSITLLYKSDLLTLKICTQPFDVGRDSSVGTATRYGLDGPEIVSRWGRHFLHLSRPALGPTNPLYNGYRVFPGRKATRAWRSPPTPI